VLKIEPYEPQIAALLEEGLKLPPLVARVLASRGIRTREEGERFLYPRIEHLSDPFLLPDMAQAAGAVVAAVRSGRRIGLFGDYDADGITATALVLNFLTEAGARPEVYLPGREEGYGLNAQAVRELRMRGVDLLVCLDCGSSNAAEIELANSLGMEIVVIDHHETADPLPAAAALVNPKRKDSLFPTRELAACGVAFFFLIALRRVMDAAGLPAASINLKRQLDLAALGTVADMVPLAGDNRVLVKFGMEMMQKQPRAWLKSFFRQNMIYQQRLDNYALSFIIIPRINAAGRVSDPKAALEFLIAPEDEACGRLLADLNTANRTRQGMEEAVIGEAVAMMEADGATERQSLVLFKEDWPIGVIGIAAQKLAESCGKPCIIFTRSDGAWKGSARGVAGLDLYGAVSTLSDMLIKFGGHRYACGLSVRDEERRRFPDAFEEAVATALAGREKVVSVDAVIEFEELTAGLVDSIELLAPFGFGNPRPAFLLTPSAVSGTGIRSVRLTDSKSRVWYGNMQKRMEVPEGPGVQVVACPAIREEMGERFVHLRIREFVTGQQG
jgi:single-stranded-DNA-specific exonuclease